MKVMLVDDNRLMLEGLQNLLEVHNIQIAGTAKDGLEAVALAQKLQADVILMDISMPRMDGLEATRLIKAQMPEAKIVILTTSIEDQALFEAVKSGAYGYLLKSIDSDELVEALEHAQQGIPPFSPGLAVKLLNEFARLAKPQEGKSSDVQGKSTCEGFESKLTSRQIEVLTLIAKGLSYKEVGAKLDLSPSTVKYHMVEIMNLLHLENRAQVLAYAGRFNLEGNGTAI
jgi:DNA-binding NarL/FixJ family response regulator